MNDGDACVDWALNYAEVADNAGNIVLIENPRRSCLRQLPRMKRLIARAGWVEAEHRLCTHFGARCKRQWTAGNVEEVKLLHHPDGYHLHDETEWKPWYSDSEDRWKYPTKEEAEYTASLAFSYAALMTMAAVRRGRAKMRVPRLPRADPTGYRESLRVVFL